MTHESSKRIMEIMDEVRRQLGVEYEADLVPVSWKILALQMNSHVSNHLGNYRFLNA